MSATNQRNFEKWPLSFKLFVWGCVKTLGLDWWLQKIVVLAMQWFHVYAQRLLNLRHWRMDEMGGAYMLNFLLLSGDITKHNTGRNMKLSEITRFRSTFRAIFLTGQSLNAFNINISEFSVPHCYVLLSHASNLRYGSEEHPCLKRLQ